MLCNWQVFVRCFVWMTCLTASVLISSPDMSLMPTMDKVRARSSVFTSLSTAESKHIGLVFGKSQSYNQSAGRNRTARSTAPQHSSSLVTPWSAAQTRAYSAQSQESHHFAPPVPHSQFRQQISQLPLELTRPVPRVLDSRFLFFVPDNNIESPIWWALLYLNTYQFFCTTGHMVHRRIYLNVLYKSLVQL